MSDGQVVAHSLYIYAPNKGAPIFFTAAFTVSFIGHFWQCCRYRSWTVNGLHPLCAILYTVGYALREYGAYNYTYTGTQHKTLMIYIMSQVFINICPPLLELSNYHILGRIFTYIPCKAPISPSHVFAIFGTIMSVVEALNALGVAFTSNPTGDKQDLGKVLILAALSIQLCLILTFVSVAGLFQVRCYKGGLCNKKTRHLPTLMVTLYVSMGLILIRCIYRLIEHSGNTALDINDKAKLQSLDPLLRYEWVTYVFDGATMLLNSWLWNVFNAGRYLPRNKGIHLSSEGVEVDESEEGIGAREFGRAMLQVASLGVWGVVFARKDGVEMGEEDFVMACDL
ncbi:hypothetical protein BDV06DRAFT_214109 [Aspergillus oleicola]